MIRHADRMLEELKKTGKTHTIVRWGSWPREFNRDYTADVLTKLGEGDMEAGKNMVIIGNDAPRGGMLGKFVELKPEYQNAKC